MTYDVVVVGGGHNGLVAGCYLARAGLKTIVVEKEERLGGMTMSAPLIAAAPEHMVNPGAYENVYLRAGGVVEDLDLRHHGYREADSVGWAWLGASGESILFQRDLDATAREIARHSEGDARRYLELMEIAVRALALQGRYFASLPSRPSWATLAAAARTLVADRRLRHGLGAMLASTAVDAIAGTFESVPVRGAFASIATILGAPTMEGSGMAMLGPSTLHHKGAARPIGGMGGLVSALERCLRAHGGTTRTAAEVAEIGMTGGRVDRVALTDGTTVSATRAVVTAVPVQRVPDLVDGGLAAGVGERLRAAPANASGVATLTVNLALSGRLEVPNHQPGRSDGVDLRQPALFTGTFDGVLDTCTRAARGELASDPPWWATIFTAMDPSQAPAGQDTVQLYCPAPVQLRGGWTNGKADAADRLVDAVAPALPGVREHELGRHAETPEELSCRTGTVNGCLYHVDHLPTRLGPLRPALGAAGYRTSAPGLYITGAGCHPSGGVSGLPGRLAARTVIADLTRETRRRTRRAA